MIKPRYSLKIWVEQKIQSAGYLIKVSEKHLNLQKKRGLKNANFSTSTILKKLTFLRVILTCDYLTFFLNFLFESDEKIA